MAEQYDLIAEPRSDVGKGASRRLRRIEDLVPAIIYGAGKDAAPVTIPHKDLHHALEDEGFYSRIVTIRTGKDTDQVILKALQRHPAKDRILHADFLRVRMDQAITVRVPLHFINEDSCPGVKNQGGVVAHTETDIEVSCLPGNLPQFIEVDIGALELGDSVHQSDLQLPEGVEIAGVQDEEVDPIIASVHMPRVEVIEEPEAEEEEAAAEEGAEGAEAEEGGEEQASDSDSASEEGESEED